MTDRARRVGGWVGGPGGHCSPDHPLQPPLVGLPGPASLSGPPFSVSGPWCWTPVLPSRLPTRYTPPRYHTRPYITQCRPCTVRALVQ